jgi:hypothetical protein
METVEITYEDGSVATWFISEKELVDRIAVAVESVTGRSPDSVGP